jgi:hypothetical protein
MCVQNPGTTPQLVGSDQAVLPLGNSGLGAINSNPEATHYIYHTHWEMGAHERLTFTEVQKLITTSISPDSVSVHVNCTNGRVLFFSFFKSVDQYRDRDDVISALLTLCHNVK